jgi:hypothetical protein
VRRQILQRQIGRSRSRLPRVQRTAVSASCETFERLRQAPQRGDAFVVAPGRRSRRFAHPKKGTNSVKNQTSTASADIQRYYESSDDELAGGT